MEPKLLTLCIYLTDECNLNCIHCWQTAPVAGKRKYSALKFNECQNALSDAIKMGLKSVVFSGGEPLLNPEFQKFAEFFYENRIQMSLETNGVYISETEIFNTIKSCEVYCAISLDGISPAIHNKQRGSKDAFQQTVKSIDKLNMEKIYFQIIMAISKFNYHELVPLLDWVKEKWKFCDKFKINVVNELGRGKFMDKKGLLFRPEEVTRVSEEVAGLVDRYPFISLHLDPVFISFKNLMLNYSCGGHCGYKYALSILANGNVSICSLGKQVDKYIFGHVSTIDIKDTWENNPILTDIHEDTYTKLQGICSNCIFRKKCLGGCRAVALCSYGDFFAPHPFCQEYYDHGDFPKARLIHEAK